MEQNQKTELENSAVAGKEHWQDNLCHGYILATSVGRTCGTRLGVCGKIRYDRRKTN